MDESFYYSTHGSLRLKGGYSLVEWKNISDLIATTGATPVRDEVSGSMYYTDSDGFKHVVWYEDETSIKNKTHYTQTYELAGVSIYAIGMEDQKFWEAIY